MYLKISCFDPLNSSFSGAVKEICINFLIIPISIVVEYSYILQSPYSDSVQTGAETDQNYNYDAGASFQGMKIYCVH